MFLKKISCLFCFAVTICLFVSEPCTAAFSKRDIRTSLYTIKAAEILQNLDTSVDPCMNFYNFTCGGYKPNSDAPIITSSGYEKYFKQLQNLQRILVSQRKLLGSDISVARNIYANCIKIVPDKVNKTEIVKSILTDIGLYNKIETGLDKENYELNNDFDWINGVHKLREKGLNFRLFFGLYVTPRSETDKRNILEIRRPFFSTENKEYKGNNSLMQKLEVARKMPENLSIVNATDFITTLNNSFPLQKFIEGFLPKDMNFSLDTEIRLDENYVTKMIELLPLLSVSDFEELLSVKIEKEIDTLLLPKLGPSVRFFNCIQLAASLDFNFQVGVLKYHFTDEMKNYVTIMTKTILETTKGFVNNMTGIDEEFRTKAMNNLSNLQVMVGYSKNTIINPELDWNNMDIHKYLGNIFTVFKHQMDSKFRQINLVNDVREWDNKVSPTTFNAAYEENSNTLSLPALILTSKMHELALPSYLNYGSVGVIIGHELSHAIDNFISTRFAAAKKCLTRQSSELTGKVKDNLKEDFADLLGYKLAYDSFLSSKLRPQDNFSLPGLNYNSRQMFWIAAANSWCDKNAFAGNVDDHSSSFERVMLPLFNSREFAGDFNCPIGSPMNPEIKCY